MNRSVSGSVVHTASVGRKRTTSPCPFLEGYGQYIMKIHLDAEFWPTLHTASVVINTIELRG